MSSPALAILWEIWRKNRLGLLVILAAIPVWAVLSRLLMGPLQPSDDALKGIWPILVLLADGLAMWVSLFALGVIFCFTETDPKRGHARFPSRLFALPVRTITLVSCPMIYGVIAVIAVAFAWEKLVLGSLRVADWMPQRFLPLMFPAAAMVLLQATVWSLPAFPGNRLLVLGALLFGLLWLAIEPNAHGSVGDWSQQRVASYQHRSSIALAGASVVAYLAALIAIERDRRGGGIGWAASMWRRVWAGLEFLPRRATSFHSLPAAQRWLEWRRGGFLLPLTVGAFMALILGPIGWIVKLEGPPATTVIDAEPTATMFCLVLALPPVMAFVIGKRLAEIELNASAFQFLRPITCGELVVRKLQMAACSTIVSGAMVLVITPIWLALWCDPSLLVRGWHMLQARYSAPALAALLSLGLLTIAALAWRWLVVSLYLGLWGRPKVFIASAACSFVGGWLLLIIVSINFDHAKQLKQWEEFARYLVVLVILKWLVGVWAFREAHRRGLMTARVIFAYAAIWLSVTVGVAIFGGLALRGTLVPTPVIVLGSMLLFPLARIGLAPLALNAHRHR
jgi:hypothetical protein